MSVLPSVDCPETVRFPTSAPEVVANPNTAPLAVREVHVKGPLTDRLLSVPPPAEKLPDTDSGVEIVSPPEE
jgi:hypothetical protein